MSNPMSGIMGEVDEVKLSFIQSGAQVGKFWFDEKAEKFRFEGDTDKAAAIFVAKIIEELNRIEASSQGVILR